MPTNESRKLATNQIVSTRVLISSLMGYGSPNSGDEFLLFGALGNKRLKTSRDPFLLDKMSAGDVRKNGINYGHLALGLEPPRMQSTAMRPRHS